ncbi:unnamed protein product [Symbiodinium sp. CCMP2592]|nr:unnamed protein product [Symbiodinium sp. CCMP2592]
MAQLVLLDAASTPSQVQKAVHAALTTWREPRWATKALSQLKKQKKGAVAAQVLGAMRRLTCETSSFHFNTVISACAESGLWQLALHVLSGMSKLTAEQNIISFSSCIAACDSCCQWQYALHLLGLSSSARLQHSIITYNSLVNACAAASKWRLALHLFWLSFEVSLLPTVVSYGAAINACEKAGEWKPAFSLLHAAQASGISPNTIMYDACISTYGKGGQWQMACLHLSRMAVAKVKRIDISFNSAISACEKNSYWKAALGVLGNDLRLRGCIFELSWTRHPAKSIVNGWRQLFHRKRAYKRACRRAAATGQTTYRGRLVTASSLNAQYVTALGRTNPTTRSGPTQGETPSLDSRLRIMTWNCGGMSADLYDVVCEWLQRTRDTDVVILQEVHWGLGKQDATWRIPGWSLVVTADPNCRYSGVAMAISSRVACSQDITFCSWIPGADEDLQQLLQVHNLVVLNTWGRAGPTHTATFVNGDVHSQIDFVAVRKEECVSRNGPELTELQQATCTIFRQTTAEEGQAWCEQHHTAFADDNLAQWEIQSLSDLSVMCKQIRVLFDILQESGMSINVLKSGLLLRLQGSVAKAWLRQHSRTTTTGVVINVGIPGRPIEIPRQDVLTYLGVQLSYGSFEMQTCLFRLRAAQQVRQRLIKVLHTNGLRVRLRLQLYGACVRSSLLYGVHAVGLSSAIIRRLEAADARSVRAIVRCPVHLTHVSNQVLFQRYKLNSITDLLIKLLGGVSRKQRMSMRPPVFASSLSSLGKHPDAILPKTGKLDGVTYVSHSVDGSCPVLYVLRNSSQTHASTSAVEPTGDAIPLVNSSMIVPPEPEGQPTTAAQEMMEVLGLAKQKASALEAEAGDRRDRSWGDSSDPWDRPQKWHKPPQKGHGGKGSASWDSWKPHSKDWFDLDDEEKTPGLDMATQNLISVLVRMALRHEQELAQLRIDTTVICYLDTGATGILPMVRQVAETWATEAEAGKVKSPLKVILLLSILQEASTRITGILQDESKLQKAYDWEWLKKGEQGLDPLWTYFQWCPSEKKQLLSKLEPVKNTEIQGHLDFLAGHLAEPNVLTRFRSTRKMSATDRYASAVLPFFCCLSLRGEVAAKCHGSIRALVNSSALKPIGMRIKPARGERQPLAAELEKAYLAVPYTQWQERAPQTGRQARAPPAEAAPEKAKEPDFGALSWISMLTGQAQLCLGEVHRAIQLANKPGKLYLPGCLEWSPVLAGWRHLSRQHDAGIFMKHLLEYAASPVLQGCWQARLDTPHLVTDGGALSIPVPLTVQGPSLQDTVHRWHTQHTVHALHGDQGLVILQLNRYDNVAGLSLKDDSLVTVEPGAVILIPAFVAAEGIEVEMRRYVIAFVIFHVGENVDCGHYQAALCIPTHSHLTASAAAADTHWEYRVCDDRRKPRQARQADLHCIHHNTYLVGLLRSE